MLKSRNQQNKRDLNTFEQVYSYALNLLSYRDYGCEELRKRLIAAGANKEYWSEVEAKLKDYKLLDDTKYARLLYQSWLKKKYYGINHLAQEFEKHSLSLENFPAIVDAFTEDLEVEHAEAATNVFWGKHKLDAFDNLYEYKNALGRFLFSRGFKMNIIHKIFEKYTGKQLS